MPRSTGARLPPSCGHCGRRYSVGARALEFAILTGVRSGEVRGATWAEIDIKAGLWTIPPSA